MAVKVLFLLYVLGPYIILQDRLGAKQCNVVGELTAPGARSGQVAVVTGATGGIGSRVTSALLRAGMHVILGLRNLESGKRLEESVRKEGITSGQLTILSLDLSSFASVREFAAAVLSKTTTINLLLNNGGIMPLQYRQTADNLEESWQVNYLSHVLLSHLLMPALHSTASSGAPARLVSITSVLHLGVSPIDYENINNPKRFGALDAYTRTKLAQLMFSLYLNDKLTSVNSGVQAVAAHPGIVHTPMVDRILGKYNPIPVKYVLKPIDAGARSIVFACLEGRGGQNLGNCRPDRVSSLARDPAAQRALYHYSMKTLQINKFGGLFD